MYISRSKLLICHFFHSVEKWVVSSWQLRSSNHRRNCKMSFLLTVPICYHDILNCLYIRKSKWSACYAEWMKQTKIRPYVHNEGNVGLSRQSLRDVQDMSKEKWWGIRRLKNTVFIRACQSPLFRAAVIMPTGWWESVIVCHIVSRNIYCSVTLGTSSAESKKWKRTHPETSQNMQSIICLT